MMTFPHFPCYTSPMQPRVRIEYILILLSALSFAVTALCTSRMNREYAALTTTRAQEGRQIMFDIKKYYEDFEYPKG